MRRIILQLLSTLLLAGCGYSRPSLISEKVLPIDALVASIQCEFKDAVRTQIFIKNRTWLNTWQGAYTITLKGNESTILKATSAFPFNLGRGSALGLGVGGGTTATANRTALLKFNLSFKDVKKALDCTYGASDAAHPFLRQGIGFEEWMDRAISDAVGPAGGLNSKKISGLGHTFEFSIDLNGSLAPTFTIAPAPVVTLSPSATVDRLEDNSVDVTLAPAATTGKRTTATTIAFSKAQQEQVDELIAALKKLAEKTDRLNAELNDRNNRALLEKQDQLVILNDNLRTAQGLGTKLEGLDVSKQTELRNELARQVQKIAELQKKKGELVRAEDTAAQLNARYTQLLAHPAVTRTVETQTFQRNVSIPADQNPNIAAIQTQLILERTFGNLRTINP